MRIAGRILSPELLKHLQEQAPVCSRRALAVQLCQQADWRSPSGQPALMTARKALAQLARAGHLPPPIYPPPPPVRPLPPAAPIPLMPQPLEDLQSLEILLLPPGPSALSVQWRQLLSQFHYLGPGPTPLTRSRPRALIESRPLVKQAERRFLFSK